MLNVLQVTVAPKNPRVYQFLKGVYRLTGRFFDDSDENMFSGVLMTELMEG
jgi:hypothetical protein